MQATGAFTPNAEITPANEELSYIRLNPRTYTPFGLGKLEAAFETIHEFLCAHRFASRPDSNSVVRYALWLQNLSPWHHERLIRWWQDGIEGTGKVPILSVETKPEVLRFSGGTDADLRLQWQEFLIRIIADAFDLPPMLLGLERDVKRNTATTQYDDAFRTAVVLVARLIAEQLTRDVISKRLGWNDLEFVFPDVEAPNELEQAQIQQILLGRGVLTETKCGACAGCRPLHKVGCQMHRGWSESSGQWSVVSWWRRGSYSHNVEAQELSETPISKRERRSSYFGLSQWYSITMATPLRLGLREHRKPQERWE